MGLGSDKEISKLEFIEAMRRRLEEEKPGLGANVDESGVQKNMGALGEAVFRIVTVHAETVSSTDTDSAFWQWVSDVNAWLAKVAAWQQGIAQAFTSWTPTLTAEQNLRTAVTALPSPGSPPSTSPVKVQGKVI